MKRDPFGHLIFIKRILISLIGWLTWWRYNKLNKTEVSGTEHLRDLPETNVLFISNHQTYFADVIAMLHVFCSVKNNFENSLRSPRYLFRPKVNTYFVAAEETMKTGFLPRLFAYVGSVSIQRTWRDAGKDVNRRVRMDDISNIGKALGDGWVITFPQGTTKVYAEGRRGVTHIVKKYQPVVVPVVIDGFRRAFDKKGLKLKKKGVKLSIRFKAPITIDFEQESDDMLVNIMHAIEQSPEFQWPRAHA
ncbi:MAG: phospholipid/glycerol acyltransferase [Bacteroidetes bacterium]|nr:MAG: phospholipid/glycerol acyltransferase [Bacteroidota bacterium]